MKQGTLLLMQIWQKVMSMLTKQKSQQRLELEQLSRDELIDEVVALRQINDSRPPSS